MHLTPGEGGGFFQKHWVQVSRCGVERYSWMNTYRSWKKYPNGYQISWNTYPKRYLDLRHYFDLRRDVLYGTPGDRLRPPKVVFKIEIQPRTIPLLKYDVIGYPKQRCYPEFSKWHTNVNQIGKKDTRNRQKPYINERHICTHPHYGRTPARGLT